MSLKDLVFGEGNWVGLVCLDDSSLIYKLFDKTDTELLEFSIPKEDFPGATFKVKDTPKVFMRWIRKEVERQKVEQLQIEEARAAWEKELAEKEKA